MPNSPIVAVGDIDTVGVFAAFGIRVVGVESSEHAEELVRDVARDPEVRLIFMTEPVYEWTTAIVETYRGRPTPVITLIPTVSGNRHIAASQLRQAVRIAIGSEIV